MATKLYDCIVATSEYQDRNGQKKRHWENVGSVFQDTDNNGNSYSYIMLKRVFNPAGIDVREGADAIRISLSKPQPKQAAQGQPQSQQQSQSAQNNQWQAQNTTQQQQQIPDFSQSQSQGQNQQYDPFGENVENIPF